jgi:hypothetical protein
MIQLVGFEFNGEIFSGVERMVLSGVLGTFGVLSVVNLWSVRGGLRGKGGFWMARFLGVWILQNFRIYFLELRSTKTKMEFALQGKQLYNLSNPWAIRLSGHPINKIDTPL